MQPALNRWLQARFCSVASMMVLGRSNVVACVWTVEGVDHGGEHEKTAQDMGAWFLLRYSSEFMLTVVHRGVLGNEWAGCEGQGDTSLI
jgi:hypothetical protein